MAPDKPISRYDRQIVFPPLGPAGQRRLGRARVLIVGVGGLGCMSAELLTRAGVGFLRLVDDDLVRIENVHRQVLFDEADAAAARPKALAAAARLARINGEPQLQPIVARFTAGNAAELAEGVDLILDGSDNFETRFIINDLAVRDGKPWIMAGVVGAEAQLMAVLPGRTPCLRCVMPTPPPVCADMSCRAAGVLPPAVTAIASLQAVEALKILAGAMDAVSPYLLKLDMWSNTIQRIDLRAAAAGDCPCCKKRDFEYLPA